MELPVLQRQISWNCLFYRVSECKILLRKLIDYKLRIHCETCPGKVEYSNASDWSIFPRRPERDPGCPAIWKCQGISMQGEKVRGSQGILLCEIHFSQSEHPNFENSALVS